MVDRRRSDSNPMVAMGRCGCTSQFGNLNCTLFTGGVSTNDNQILLNSMAIAQSVKNRSVVNYLSNITKGAVVRPDTHQYGCLLYTSPSPRD